jgi:hypothetical protein
MTTLKMEAADFSETLVHTYQTPRRHIIGESDIHDGIEPSWNHSCFVFKMSCVQISVTQTASPDLMFVVIFLSSPTQML